MFSPTLLKMFLTLSNCLLPLPQPGFAVRPTEVSVTWVPPLTSVLPKASSAGSGGVSTALPLLAVASGEGGASRPEPGLCCTGGSQVGRVEPAEESVSFPAVFSGNSAAAWLWVPMGTALLRTVNPLEGFGLLSSL